MENYDDDYSFSVTTPNGIEMKCDTLGTVMDEDGHCIILYTDYTLDKENKFNIYASKLVKDGDAIRLESIRDIENYPQILEALIKVRDEVEKKEE
jgi:hypothetical protein